MPEVLQQMLNYVIAIYIRLSAEDGDLSIQKMDRFVQSECGAAERLSRVLL